MSTARRYHHSYDDYLRLESESPLKLEYSDGEIFAMAGGTPEHGALAMQFVRLTSATLPSSCTVFSSDVKVRVVASDLATYPDVSITCGALVPPSDDPNAVTNPRFIIEVTSPSTEDYDRGDKLSQYKQLPSLDAVFLISHRSRRVTIVSRAGSRWEVRDVRAGERVEFDGVIVFEVNDLYAVAPSIVS
jgi:Uma2 family endonuclease